MESNKLNKVFEDHVGIIYHNRMEDIIDDLEYDFILTDPPYNINYKYPGYDDNLSDEDYINLFTHFQNKKCAIIHYPEAICNYICEGIGPVDKIVSWCYSNNASFKAHRSIAFFNCKPNFNNVKQRYKDYKDKRVIKLVENGSEGARSYDWFADIQLIKNTGDEKIKGFTNQIPIKLLERILLLATKEGDKVIDPFAGTSSLYYACMNTGRKYIGIEQSKEHIQLFKDNYEKRIKK